MNKASEPYPLSTREHNWRRRILKRLLEPRALLFWLALIYSGFEFVNAMQFRNNPFVVNWQIFVFNLMWSPFLMLITSALILIPRLSTIALGMAIAAYLIYVTAYRGMVSIPGSHGVPIFSFDALRIWFKGMPDKLVLLAAFGSVALVFGTVQLWRLLRVRRKHSS